MHSPKDRRIICPPARLKRKLNELVLIYGPKLAVQVRSGIFKVL
jgi:hypothetical protein